jgi:L-ascorbate metabolism protein UlaG (beta-lactamase superfamily)
MEIVFYGHACFGIKTKKARIIIDPYEEQLGAKLPPLKADIVAVTHNHFDHNFVAAVAGPEKGIAPKVINGPGEYEIQGLEIEGVASYHDDKQGAERGPNTIYLFNAEGIKVCHLGDLGQSALTDEQLEKLSLVDVLMVPVGGHFCLDAKRAVTVINQIEPKIIIPMHYQEDWLKGIEFDSLDKFIQEIGMDYETLDVLRLSASDIPEEERKLIILKKQ